MKKPLNLLLFLGVFHFLPAQTTLRILDMETRAPVIGASVSFSAETGKWATDTLGQVQITTEWPKTGQIRVNHLAYQPLQIPCSSLDVQQPIFLEPLQSTLNTVVVSAGMKPVSKDISPIPVEIYTPRFFQKNASSNLFESLTMVNGVRPQLNCNVCNTGDIHINGMEGPYTMVAIDGMPIVSGLSTVYGLSGIPNGMIDRIEITKGPASTLYGSEAVGGLINVITKNVLTAPKVTLDAFATGLGELNLDAAMTARWKKARTLLGVNYYRFNRRLDINDDNFTDITLQNRVSVFNKWSFQRKNKRIATVAARLVHENRWGGELQWEEQWRGTDSIYGESIYTNRVELLGKYQLPVSGNPIMLDISWNLHQQDSYYGNIPYDGIQQIGFSQLSSHIALGQKHELLWGVSSRITALDDNTPVTASPDGQKNEPSLTWLPGVFLQEEWTIDQQNLILTGLRYDFHTQHGSILTPRVSWKWSPDPFHILRLTGGSGYRVANIFTEDHAALSGAREVVITEALKPERSWNANLNYVQKFFPKALGFIGLDASLFYTYFYNQILPDYNTNPQQIIYRNLRGSAVSTGASLNLEFNFKNGIKCMAGATYMDVYKMEEGQKQVQLFAPGLSGNWAFSFPLKALKSTIDYTGSWTGPMYLPVVPNDYRPEQSPWYTLHNVQVTRSLRTGLEIYLGVKNLFGFYPREDVILRAFDRFDKQTDINNPNGYTFDPSYNYAPIQRQKVVLGIRFTLP